MKATTGGNYFAVVLNRDETLTEWSPLHGGDSWEGTWRGSYSNPDMIDMHIGPYNAQLSRQNSSGTHLAGVERVLEGGSVRDTGWVWMASIGDKRAVQSVLGQLAGSERKVLIGALTRVRRLRQLSVLAIVGVFLAAAGAFGFANWLVGRFTPDLDPGRSTIVRWLAQSYTAPGSALEWALSAVGVGLSTMLIATGAAVLIASLRRLSRLGGIVRSELVVRSVGKSFVLGAAAALLGWAVIEAANRLDHSWPLWIGLPLVFLVVDIFEVALDEAEG